MAKKPVVDDVTLSVAELMAGNTAAPASGRGHRSQLYLWLRGHHDQLAEGFGRNGPSWIQIARQLGVNGVYDGAGKQPAPETVRATWYRVRRDVAAALARRAGPASVDVMVPPPVASSPPPVASPPPLPSPASGPAGDTDPPPRKFGLARPRGHVPSTPPPPPPVPEPERIRRSPEEVERIIADMMSGAPQNPFRRDKED